MTARTTPLRRDLSALERPFDVVVIGAGITGVQIARETSGRAWRTLLVDKGDFGSGTSSATTKYIHGGLRYLEQGDLPVVAESVRERRLLTLAAPHLLAPRRFLLPAWEWSRPGPALLGAGVGLYEALALTRNRGVDPGQRAPRARWISRDAVLRAVPWLSGEGLRGAFAYHDTASLHPERLLLALLRTAVVQGTVALNHAPVVRILTEPVPDGDPAGERARDRAAGVVIRDLATGSEHIVRAGAVVNAAGPWADLALGDLTGRLGLRVKRVKGIHLLTRALGGSDALFTRSRDGRHVVVSPWQGKSFIGPTDTPVETDPDATGVTEDDVAQVVTAVNAVSRAPLRPEDLETATVGTRPLVATGSAEAQDAYRSSRRFDILDHAGAGVSGLWSVAGGKWTTGRAVAVAVAERLDRSRLLPHARPFDSRGLPVFGAFPGTATVAASIAAAGRAVAAATSGPGGDPAGAVDVGTGEQLGRLYGTDHTELVALLAERPDLRRRLSDSPGCRDLAAQAVYAVTHEAALTLADVLDRRLLLGTMGRVSEAEVTRVARIVAPLLGWDEQRTGTEAAAEVERRRRLDAVLMAGAGHHG